MALFLCLVLSLSCRVLFIGNPGDRQGLSVGVINATHLGNRLSSVVSLLALIVLFWFLLSSEEREFLFIIEMANGDDQRAANLKC